MKKIPLLVLLAAPFVACSISTGGSRFSDIASLEKLNSGKDGAEDVYALSRQVTRPFARLYGDTQARWIDLYLGGVSTPQKIDDRFPRWIVERAGFITLDAENQRLYLLVSLAEHQAGDAEKSGQLSELIDIYSQNHGIESLRQFLGNVSEADTVRISVSLGRGRENFRKNVELFVSSR